jgi:hypothetical protein
MNTIDNILGNVNATAKHIESVRASIFDVIKRPVETCDDRFLAPEDCYNIYRSTGGIPLSGKRSMGKDFLPMQPSEFLENIIETVRDYGANLDLNTLKFREFYGGSKIEFSIELEPIVFVNQKKLNDITKMELIFSTSYDGSKSSTISLYTFRLACLNGMVRSHLEGTLKGKNTMGGKAKILSYASEVAKLVEETKDFRIKMEQLDKVKLTKTQIEDFKLSLLGYNRESLKNDVKAEGYKRQQYEILKLVEQGIDEEFGRAGETAFGLLQGITNYTNHLANRKGIATKIEPTSDEYIRFNKGVLINDKAQDLIFEFLTVAN